jgi:hypothetical protein
MPPFQNLGEIDVIFIREPPIGRADAPVDRMAGADTVDKAEFQMSRSGEKYGAPLMLSRVTTHSRCDRLGGIGTCPGRGGSREQW